MTSSVVSRSANWYVTSVSKANSTKKGTPTMGGVIIIMAILVPTLLFARLDNIYVILMIVTTLLMGLLGFADDYIKVFKKDKNGLKEHYKIIGQVVLGLIVGVTLYLSPSVVIKRNSEIVREGGVREIRFETTDTKSLETSIPSSRPITSITLRSFPFLIQG